MADLLRPRSRIRPISIRLAKRRDTYRVKAKWFVLQKRLAGETCPVVAAIPELREGKKYGHRISNKLTEVHHMFGRVGMLLLDERGWMAVSKQGHRFIHEHPERARQHGWICPKGCWNSHRALEKWHNKKDQQP